MRKTEILNNNNKIYSETTSNATYKNESQEFSIRVVFNGIERYNIGNRTLNVSPANFLIINEATVYNRQIYSAAPVQTLSVLYTSSFLRSFHHSFSSPDLLLLDDPFTIPQSPAPSFLETLYPFKGDMKFNLVHLKNLFNSGLTDDLLMSEYLNHCLINFYRIYNKEILQKSEQLKILNYQTRTELFKRLNNAKDYMLSNYDQAISLDEICKYACLSETHFFRSFKQVFHCSPHQYLIQLRLTQAKHLLKTTHYEVREIVNIVGFDCPSSFIRLFKDKFGITPGTYRGIDKAA
jgi:AraC family transcriptional regulator